MHASCILFLWSMQYKCRESQPSLTSWPLGMNLYPPFLEASCVCIHVRSREFHVPILQKHVLDFSSHLQRTKNTSRNFNPSEFSFTEMNIRIIYKKKTPNASITLGGALIPYRWVYTHEHVSGTPPPPCHYFLCFSSGQSEPFAVIRTWRKA